MLHSKSQLSDLLFALKTYQSKVAIAQSVGFPIDVSWTFVSTVLTQFARYGHHHDFKVRFFTPHIDQLLSRVFKSSKALRAVLKGPFSEKTVTSRKDALKRITRDDWFALQVKKKNLIPWKTELTCVLSRTCHYQNPTLHSLGHPVSLDAGNQSLGKSGYLLSLLFVQEAAFWIPYFRKTYLFGYFYKVFLIWIDDWSSWNEINI